jgi:hypothetical protein
VRRILTALLAGALAGCASGGGSDDPGTPDAGGPVTGPTADAEPSVIPRPDAASDSFESTFDGDLDGWIAGDAGGEYDQAKFLADEGHPGGTVFLDGSDLGSPDADPNSWVEREVELPTGAVTLKFDTRASENDGALRVRLITPDDQSHIVLDYEVLSGVTWVGRSADLSVYGGQTVTLRFEQNDNDLGQGEMRYVDNVRID